MPFEHRTVLAEEAVGLMAVRSGGTYLDGTLGGGGHAELILEKSSPDGRLIGFDRDRNALEAAGKRLARYGGRVMLVHANYADMADQLQLFGVGAIDGMLLDLGVSSHQLDTAERGFSFQKDALLDMRMDPEAHMTAAELVNVLPVAELARIIREYGEERWASRIAERIVAERLISPIERTLQLADIVKGAIPRAKWEERIHPATRTFQALRIAVNDELGSLERGLDAGFEMLSSAGRIVVISFHSLEDRIVKNFFKRQAQGCVCPKRVPVCVCGNQPHMKIITARPIVAGAQEETQNPRARSAKLRAAEKL